MTFCTLIYIYIYINDSFSCSHVLALMYLAIVCQLMFTLPNQLQFQLFSVYMYWL